MRPLHQRAIAIFAAALVLAACTGLPLAPIRDRDNDPGAPRPGDPKVSLDKATPQTGSPPEVVR
jgi:hypothetical protein